MSRRGCCYDNAVMERFFWSLKHEWTNHERFANLEEARLSVFNYTETFYNPVRLHETLNYRSPDSHEADNAPAVAAQDTSRQESVSPGPPHFHKSASPA